MNEKGRVMNRLRVVCVCAVVAVALTGCGEKTVNPNFSSANPELLRIGGEKPEDKGPEIINMGSYCLSVTEKWKADGKTPDGQMLWSKDSLRKAIPCR